MRVWLDDVRDMPEDFDKHVYNADDAIALLESGKVTHMSFDHDLGIDLRLKNGYDVAVWVERMAYLGKIQPFTWEVHSANPRGAERIRMALSMADQYWMHHINKKYNSTVA